MGSVLREGWEVKSLKEIGETQTGNTPATKEIDNYGDYIPFVKPAHFKIDGSIDSKDSALSEKGLKSARLFKANSILMVCIGATIGKTGFSKIEVTSNQQINAFTPPQEFEAKFFYYLFIADEFQNKIIKNSAQATLPIINKSKWENLLVSFPKEKKEQQKIVTILDEAFSAIEKAKENAELNLKNAKELFESYLQGVFENKGEGWEEKTLEDICTKITDGVHKKPVYTSEGIPFIKINNLTKGDGISFSDVSYISREDHELYIKRTKPEKGDILITKDGTIGIVRIIDTDIEFSIFVSVALIKPIDKDMSPYLKYVLISPSIQGQIKPKGAALKHLYLKDLRKFVIKVPPLQTQKIIVKKLDILSEQTKNLEKIYEQKIKDLDELKKSILQKAFNGELT